MVSDSAIREVARRLVEAADSPRKIFLFGSYARGEANEESDLDILVVEKELPDPTAEYVRLREAVGSVGVGVDVLLYSEAELERRRDWCSNPVYWAVREGKLLYESET
jgi:uncharacterized protein